MPTARPSLSDPDGTAGVARARRVAERLRERLGDGGWALYGMGSLGYGNYLRGWSDLDLDVVVVDGAVPALTAITGDELSDWIARQGFPDVDIKVFPVERLQTLSDVPLYGLANRVAMLVDSAVHLHGEDIRGVLPRPTLPVLAREAAQVALALGRQDEQWWARRPRDDVAALLALPARLLYTTRTGRVVDKRTALESLFSEVPQPPADLWPWFSWALACRLSPVVRDLPEQGMPAARAAARAGILWAFGELQ